MAFPPDNRVVSIDAYRGLVMLAMVSGGLSIGSTVSANPELLTGTAGDTWRKIAYQFSHAPWAGCSFWDLIQPSFMFLVGVSLPFSAQARLSKKQSSGGMFGHALVRSLLLVLLGVVLSSQSQDFSVINVKLVNVLTQIGLGYMFVYVLLHRGLLVHLLAIAAILGGYWYVFYQHQPPGNSTENIKTYLAEHAGERLVEEHKPTSETGEDLVDLAVTAEVTQYEDAMRAHWNRHTNFAAAADRWFLNLFPRNETVWKPASDEVNAAAVDAAAADDDVPVVREEGQSPATQSSGGMGFWVNNGGYQTLNFVPSIATMIFGLIAGLILISDYRDSGKLVRLVVFSVLCFGGAFAMDSELIPFEVPQQWSVCPVVKRIWTPSWALFSAGWTFAILAAFFLVVDVMKFRRWTFPLAIVGMNSIAMYVLAQLTKGWFTRMLRITTNFIDGMTGTSASAFLFGDGTFVRIYQSIAVVVMLWLVCFWLYRRKLFVRI